MQLCIAESNANSNQRYAPVTIVREHKGSPVFVRLSVCLSLIKLLRYRVCVIFSIDYTCCRHKEDIYFFEVNTKYISSNVLKISVISRVRSTSEMLIFSTYEMKYCWYLPKKVNFLSIFFVKGGNLNFFPSDFSLILLGSACLAG